MGGVAKIFSGANQPAQPASPLSPDAADLDLQAARRARAFSIFSLSRGYGANFSSPTSMGTKPSAGLLSYGLPESSLLGSGQVGDDTGTTAAPDLRAKPAPGAVTATQKPIDPNNPNAPTPQSQMAGFKL